jgi:hypothetical protein
MSRIVTITGRFVESAAGLITTPWPATIGILLLLHRIFDLVPARAHPPVRLFNARVRGAQVDRAASNQTPLVHSVSPMAHTGQHSDGAPAAMVGSGWVSVLGYVPAHPPNGLAEPQLRQRRRPSMLAISAARHGGARR